VKQELPWSKYLKVPRRRRKKIPKLKLATALLLMYDCFEKKITADNTTERVQALVSRLLFVCVWPSLQAVDRYACMNGFSGPWERAGWKGSRGYPISSGVGDLHQ